MQDFNHQQYDNICKCEKLVVPGTTEDDASCVPLPLTTSQSSQSSPCCVNDTTQPSTILTYHDDEGGTTHIHIYNQFVFLQAEVHQPSFKRKIVLLVLTPSYYFFCQKDQVTRKTLELYRFEVLSIELMGPT